ncbi:MAG: hypothetical protein Q7U04_05515 [Bacteriovorax sp.]|nr:hypothetical protein [Bacteriovorax sp.]
MKQRILIKKWAKDTTIANLIFHDENDENDENDESEDCEDQP